MDFVGGECSVGFLVSFGLVLDMYHVCTTMLDPPIPGSETGGGDGEGFLQLESP
jgi:hypothetical protein